MRHVALVLFAMFALTLGVTTSASAQDIDCPGLSFEEAQDILAQDPSDPHGLDRDNDGVACENNASDGGTQSGTTDDTGDDGTEDTTDLPATGVGSTQATASAVSLLGTMAVVFMLTAALVRRSASPRL